MYKRQALLVCFHVGSAGEKEPLKASGFRERHGLDLLLKPLPALPGKYKKAAVEALGYVKAFSQVLAEFDGHDDAALGIDIMLVLADQHSRHFLGKQKKYISLSSTFPHLSPLNE